MIEEYGHIPDAFLLNPEETEELRTNKRYLTAYATQKLRKLKMNNIAQKGSLMVVFHLENLFVKVRNL
jgi:hypothetical protein